MYNDITTIVFDMGGVLVDLDRGACIDDFRRMGFPQADALLNSYHQKGVFGGLEDGSVSPAMLYDYIRRETGRPITGEQVDAALEKFLVGIAAWKFDMLADLHRRFKVLMLSNTNPIMMRRVHELFAAVGGRLEDYFDRLFLSFEMGALKPDARIFTMMTAEAGIDPHRTLFIDDGPDNVAAASALGFQTYRPREREDFRHIFDTL